MRFPENWIARIGSPGGNDSSGGIVSPGGLTPKWNGYGVRIGAGIANFQKMRKNPTPEPIPLPES